MRFAMTAKTLVRERASETGIRDITARNIAKVTRFRKDGDEELERTVHRLESAKGLDKAGREGVEGAFGREREGWERFNQFQAEERKRRDEEAGETWQEERQRRKGRRDPDTGRRGMPSN